MTQNFTDFKSKFKINELLIKEFDNWAWTLRPTQLAIPSTVISLKRPAENLSDLTENETQELSQVFKFLETQLKNNFSFEKINYLALMMVDFHVHFHVITRYSEKKNIDGFKIEDKDWPKPPNLLDGIPLKSNEIEDLKALILK